MDRIIYDLNKTPDLSQRPPQNFPKCGNPIDGHYCQGCALLRKKFKEDLFTYCIENGILQDFSEPSNDNTNVVNALQEPFVVKQDPEDLFTYCIENGILQDFSEPSNDNTIVVNALQEPFVVKQDPGKNSSQSPPQINHHCCYGCGDSLEDIFCHKCTCELCGRGAHYGYNCPPKVPVFPDPKPCHNQKIDELQQTLPNFDPTCYFEDGNSFTYDSTSNLVHESPNVFEPPLQPLTFSYEFCRNHAYYGHDCSLQVPFTYDPETYIFFHKCTCELCGRGAHYGYNCPPKVPVFPDPKPCHNQKIDELQQTLPNFDPTCYFEDGNSFTYDSTSNLVHESPNVFEPPLQPLTFSYEFCRNHAYYGHDCSLQFPAIHQPIREKTCAELLAEEHEANINTQPFQYSVVPQPHQEEMSLEFLQEKRNQMDSVKTFLRKFNRISFYEMPKVLSLAWETILEIELAFEDKHCQQEDILELFQRLHNDMQNIHEELAMYINTPSWDRPTEPDNSLSMGDEHLDTILAMELDEFIKSRVENLVPIPNQFEDFFDSNDESTSIDDDSFSIDNIEYVEASPLDSELVSSEVMDIVDPESSSTSLNSLLEETNTFDNSLSEFETFCFDLEEISSGSTTTYSDIYLPEYEAFYDDHIKEISSGSTTSHSDSSLYDSFIFDLSINPFPPADRSDFYEFADELAHIISPSEYDCFSFKNEPNLGDFTMDVMEDTFPTREPRVHDHNVLLTHPPFQLNLDFILFSESLFATEESRDRIDVIDGQDK
nr:hypothetical protein [Tanacetum cinerariifolium]